MKGFKIWCTANFDYHYLIGSDGVLIIKTSSEDIIKKVFNFMKNNNMSTYEELDSKRKSTCRHESAVDNIWFFKPWGEEQLLHWEKLGLKFLGE